MKAIRNHFKLLVFSLCVLVLMAGLYIYTYRSVATSTTRAVLARSVVRSQESSNSEVKNVVNVFNDTVDERARLKSLFVGDDGSVTFIETLEELGRQTGSTVTLTNVSADDMSTKPAGTIGNIQAHIEAIGSWSAVMRVLSLAEVLPYKSTVSGVRLDVVGAAGEVKGKEVPSWRLTADVAASMISSKVAAKTR